MCETLPEHSRQLIYHWFSLTCANEKEEKLFKTGTLFLSITDFQGENNTFYCSTRFHWGNYTAWVHLSAMVDVVVFYLYFLIYAYMCSYKYIYASSYKYEDADIICNSSRVCRAFQMEFTYILLKYRPFIFFYTAWTWSNVSTSKYFQYKNLIQSLSFTENCYY